MKPQPVTGLAVAFGANREEIAKLLPKYTTLPAEYQNYHGNTAWQKVVTHWFFCGLASTDIFVPKPGIDQRMALRHISAIMRSFEPKHEHKEAGCAYLCSLWFENPDLSKLED